ncbi:MAG: hypothetical protein U1F30_07735 [Steroidobacteraceae bacterium]
MRPFVFISTGMHGGPGMRRAALCALGGVLLMGVGGLVAAIMVIIALLRMLFDGFAAGGRALLVALLVGMLAQLAGTLLLRGAALLMRREASAGDAGETAGPPPGAGRAHGGVTIEGEFEERDPPETRRLR